MTDSTAHRVLLTGAAGLVGGICREGWDSSGEPFPLLRCADISPITNLRSHEEFHRCDITRLDELVAAADGCDTIVHLAAYPGAGPGYEEGDKLGDVLLQLNVVGAYNAFEAARICGCRRLVFCSSIGAVDGYRDRGQTRITWDAPVQPSSLYGASKCFGEALGSVYAITHGISVICVRLCSPRFSQQAAPAPDARVPGGDLLQPHLPGRNYDGDDGWGELRGQGTSGMTPRDCASLFAACVKVPSQQLARAQPSNPYGFAIVNGISGKPQPLCPLTVVYSSLILKCMLCFVEHAQPWLDPEAARLALGWMPLDGTAFPRL
jgi:hypothetical protein